MPNQVIVKFVKTRFGLQVPGVLEQYTARVDVYAPPDLADTKPENCKETNFELQLTPVLEQYTTRVDNKYVPVDLADLSRQGSDCKSQTV